jgi:hypothetical protein
MALLDLPKQPYRLYCTRDRGHERACIASAHAQAWNPVAATMMKLTFLGLPEDCLGAPTFPTLRCFELTQDIQRGYMWVRSYSLEWHIRIWTDKRLVCFQTLSIPGHVVRGGLVDGSTEGEKTPASRSYLEPLPRLPSETRLTDVRDVMSRRSFNTSREQTGSNRWKWMMRNPSLLPSHGGL